MTMPSLSDMEGILETTCMSILGDTIQYFPAGGDWSALKAYVDNADQNLDTGNGIAIQQDIQVQILKSDVPAKPTAQCLVALPKRPNEVFRPVNVGSDNSGNLWAFELEKVNG